MYLLKVGSPYADGRQRWPECAQYSYRAGNHDLVLFFARPTVQEIGAVRRGEAGFALFVERSQIILLWRFEGGFGWSDAPYNIHLVPEEERTIPPEPMSGELALLSVTLVDAESGIVRALRALTMPPDFTEALHRAIRAQAEMPFTRAAYRAELEPLMARYSSAELAAMAGVSFISTSSLLRSG